MLPRVECRQLLVETRSPERTVRVSETLDRTALTLAIVHSTGHETLVVLSKRQWNALSDARYHLEVEPDCEPEKPLPHGGEVEQ